MNHQLVSPHRNITAQLVHTVHYSAYELECSAKLKNYPKSAPPRKIQKV